MLFKNLKNKTEDIPLIVHQIKSPLTSVRFANQSLLENENKNLTPEQLKILANSQRKLREIEFLISSLTGTETNGYPFSCSNFEMLRAEDLITKIVDELNFELGRRGITVVKNFSEVSGVIKADKMCLHNALLNIVENAIKYTNPGGKITLSTEKTAESVIVEIADTGIGLPYSSRKQIFKKFTRLKNARLHNKQGSGLGLYIANEIVKLHGGTISFRANAPVGTVFSINLPLGYNKITTK